MQSLYVLRPRYQFLLKYFDGLNLQPILYHLQILLFIQLVLNMLELLLVHIKLLHRLLDIGEITLHDTPPELIHIRILHIHLRLFLQSLSDLPTRIRNQVNQ